MTPKEETVSLIRSEVIQRGEREREFFNRGNDTVQIRDVNLVAPPMLNSIPEEIYRYLPSLQDKDICEFGCGHGITSAWFALQGARVFSFDVAETNVVIARRTARVNGVEGRMRVEVMQAESAPLPHNAFDLVFGNGVLHHLDVELSARQILRTLKPGGVAIFREPLGENRLLEWIRRNPWRNSQHRHSPDERSFRYTDLDTLRAVFPCLVFRESELLSVVGALLREFRGNPVGSPHSERWINQLRQVDRWILSKVPALRPFASISVICMFKPNQRPQISYGEKSA